jgi:cytochrome P450 family 12
MKVYDEMSEIINNYIKEAIDELEKEPPKHDHEESILEKLVKIDKRVAIVMCADSLMAGIDTTASAYLGILYCLAKNPEKQQILRDEIMRILPDKDDKLTVANMKNLPYLRAVIKEGLRKYAPTAGSLRKIDQDIVLAGHQIPKGTEIVMAMLLSYENEKNFEKPTEFIPERWIKSNQDPQCPHAKDAHPFSFLPFSFGPRMCVGRRIAELELEALIIRTIKNFKVDWKYGDLKIKSVLVNIPEGDLKFKFTKI